MLSIVFSCVLTSGSILDVPLIADVYTTGNSNCSSLASSSINNSNISSITSAGLAAGLSILFTTTIGFKPASIAFLSTNLVCGITPS